MSLIFKTIDGFTSDMAATWQAQTGITTAFTSGDPLLALWQSVSAQLDFLQVQASLVLAVSRAQTSTGPDLDSFFAQFGFLRLGANFATGLETFSNPNISGQPILVPIGAVVQTVGGGIQYEVVADSTQPTFSAAAGGYMLAVGQTSLNATVEALVGGSTSNVLSNALVQFGSSVPGIATVTNGAPITNGVDAESDPDFRARFILFLATLAKGTEAAILAAATGVQQGLLIGLLENTQPSGAALLGSFTVVADDGSGNPPSSLLNAIFNAVDATRAFSVQPFVVAPTSLTAVIVLAIHLSGTGIPAAINTAVQNAIATVVNGLAPGGPLYGSSIITAALSVTGVASVNPASVTINGSATDLMPPISQEVRTTVGNISVSNY